MQFMAKFMASQQSIGQPTSGGDNTGDGGNDEAQMRYCDMIVIYITCIL